MERPSLKEVLRDLAESPVPVAEAYFNTKGDLTRVILAPRLAAKPEKEKDVSPHTAKPIKKTAINSLRAVDPPMSLEPERE